MTANTVTNYAKLNVKQNTTIAVVSNFCANLDKMDLIVTAFLRRVAEEPPEAMCKKCNKRSREEVSFIMHVGHGLHLEVERPIYAVP